MGIDLAECMDRRTENRLVLITLRSSRHPAVAPNCLHKLTYPAIDTRVVGSIGDCPFPTTRSRTVHGG